MSLTELMQEIDDAKQNSKGNKNVRIPRIRRDVVEDGNHPILLGDK